MNSVNLVGRLTKDPELKYGASGSAYANFTVAVNRAFKKDEVDFINCVCFGKTAEALAQYTRKGDQIAVSGAMQVEQYEKDGEKRYSTKVNVQSFTFCAKTGNGASQGNNPTGNKPNNSTTAKNNTPDVDFEDDDEFPF